MRALHFSGGKDSLAVLYLLRGELADITVYFGDTGAVYPHVVKFVRDTCEKLGARLKVVAPPVPIREFQATHGLPSDIVPVEASAQMSVYSKTDQPVKIQSIFSCCGAMVWKPLSEAMIADGITTVIRGSKACDQYVGVPDGHVDERGIVYQSPIWNWSDEDVFQYLKEVGADLPEHYAEVNNSFDCYLCTAFLTHSGAAERLRYTKKHYPKQWKELEMRARVVRHIVDRERGRLNEAFSVVDEDAI